MYTIWSQHSNNNNNNASSVCLACKKALTSIIFSPQHPSKSNLIFLQRFLVIKFLTRFLSKTKTNYRYIGIRIFFHQIKSHFIPCIKSQSEWHQRLLYTLSEVQSISSLNQVQIFSLVKFRVYITIFMVILYYNNKNFQLK